MAWQDLVAAKRRQIYNDAPPEWTLNDEYLIAARGNSVPAVVDGALSLAEQDITHRPTARLLSDLANGDLTASEVLEAFAHRAMVAHQLTNCLSESNFASARIRARELDAHWRSSNSRTAGPLHGLPVSLMDRFHVNGLDSACGLASWIGQKRTLADEGTLVRTLRHLGAIVHCKTNVPMLGETSNNIVGTTSNPYNTALSAGGACGGEGALLSLAASRLGVGTDVAGSGRIPAAFCGLFSLKCSQDRLPGDGVATVLTGLPLASGTIALLSNDLDILISCFKSIVDTHITNSNPMSLDLPWRDNSWSSVQRRRGSPSSGNGRLVLGIMACDGHVRPHPPIQRAIEQVTRALEAAGHETFQWTPPPHSPAVRNLFEIFGSTSAREAREAIDSSGEPPIPQIADWYHNQDIEPNSTADFWELCHQRNDYCSRYKAYWNETGGSTRSGRVPDGVILPVAATLAVRPGEFQYYGYSAIANVLDYPSGVFPVCMGDSNLDHLADQEILSDLDAQVRSTYRVTDAHGMPVGLQVMCPRLEEEKVLGLMHAISDAMQQHQEISLAQGNGI